MNPVFIEFRTNYSMNPCDIKHADTSACSTALSSFLQPRFPHIPVSDYYPRFEAFLSTRRLSGLSLPSVHYIITKACITPWSFSFHHYRRWETACPITHWTLPSCIPILWSDPPPSSSCNVTFSPTRFCPRSAAISTPASHLFSLPRPPTSLNPLHFPLAIRSSSGA